MAVTVHTLFSFSEIPFKLRLEAGKNGMNNSVSWVYYTEDPSTIKYTRGGEIGITTGLNIERLKKEGHDITDKDLADYLLTFIKSFQEHNASGLVINTGKYILSIPDEVIEWCNKTAFPLFSMPWEIHTIDVMQDWGNMISADFQNTHSLKNFFYKAIFEKEKFDEKQLQNTPFFDSKNFSIYLMELDEKDFNNDMEQIKRYLHFQFESHITTPQKDWCSVIHNHRVIYIVKDNTEEFEASLLTTAQKDRFFQTKRLSRSDSCTDITDLSEIFEHAETAMSFAEEDGKLFKYDSLGMYKILTAVKDKNILQQMYDQTLGKMNQYEKEKSEDYLKTLALYLKFGGNVQLVSEANFTHRNTVVYRINKIEETLGMDLSDGENRCLLQTALYIKNLLNK